MTEMVDRVARPIAAEIMELTTDQRRSFKFPDDANGDTCDRARSAARAAIEAMREPTEAMCDCGNEAAYQCERRSGLRGERYGCDTWQAMIDEAME
jgi:hypothetical protein